MKRAGDAVDAATLESPRPLAVLDAAGDEHQRSSGEQHPSWVPGRDEQVYDIGGAKHLRREGEQVAQPELVVLEVVGGDGLMVSGPPR
jgi:hypothetical protein